MDKQIKVDIYEVVKVGSVPLPERCPKCEFNLAEGDETFNKGFDVEFAMNVSVPCDYASDGEGSLLGLDGYEDEGAFFRPIGYSCPKCKYVMVHADTVRNQK